TSARSWPWPAYARVAPPIRWPPTAPAATATAAPAPVRPRPAQAAAASPAPGCGVPPGTPSLLRSGRRDEHHDARIPDEAQAGQRGRIPPPPRRDLAGPGRAVAGGRDPRLFDLPGRRDAGPVRGHEAASGAPARAAAGASGDEALVG